MYELMQKYGKALDISGAILFTVAAMASISFGDLLLFMAFVSGGGAFCCSLGVAAMRLEGEDPSTAFSILVILAVLSAAIFVARVLA